MLKVKSNYQTYPDGWGTSYEVTDRRIITVRQQVIHFAEATVGERRYWDAQVAGTTVSKAVLVPYDSQVERGDVFVIGETQYNVVQKDRRDTFPVSWLLSLEDNPVKYKEAGDD